MSTKQDNYQLLIEKLDQFIRKYYVNQIIRGALYSTGLVLVLFLAVNLLEYYYYFSPGPRRLLFFSFVGISLLALGAWVFMPLAHYFRLGKVISHEQAASIVGAHFSNIKDKLLNVLQLKHQADQTADHAADKALILASIQQKSEEIKPAPFQAAIDLSKNRKYLKYALPPLLLLLTLLVAAPSIIRDSTNRLIHNGREFLRPAPFRFVLNEEELEVVQFGDYALEVKIEGNELPNEVFIDIDNYQYRLTKTAADRFTYRFSNVQKDVEFKLFSSGVSSYEYTLNVLEKPNVASFEVKLNYPAYVGRADETVSNIGDLTIPAGTIVDWVFNAFYTDRIELCFDGESEGVDARRFAADLFTYQRKIMRDQGYKLYVSNGQLPRADSVGYQLSVIPDLYPEISVEKLQDSTERKLLYFLGDASDDYGLVSLSFNYQHTPHNGQANPLKKVPMAKPSGKQLRYNYTFDMNELGLKPGDQVTYYFEVYDNDAVNGSKPARTGTMTFSMPTVEEFEAMAEQNSEKIKDELERALTEAQKLQEDMKDLRNELLQKKEVDWQMRKELENMMQRQNQVEQQIQNAREKFEENMRNQEEFSETDQSIQQKQEQLQKLFEESISEEMKELMQQIEELMQQLEKENALEMMDEMQLSDEELEKELDRLLELYKQLELENEMNKTIDALEELAEQQEQLSEQTENKERSQEELKQEQDAINDAFDKLQEKMDEMMDKNEELENPLEMDAREEEREDIEQDLNQSEQQLQQNQNSKASQSQKRASQKMKNMANSMQMQMQSGEMEQMEEDMAALRQLLENLVGLSFEQEDVMKQLQRVEINTPRYTSLVQQQFKLNDDFKLIEDSLQALSKRVYQIESFVTEKVTDIKSNMRSTVGDLEERRKPQAADHQQRTMKNVNDLALMLSEVMNQMQQQMSGMMSGDQMCNKPGGQGNGKPGRQPSDKMSQGQQQLNQQLQQLRQRMQQGQGSPSSREFAQMAARQAALRKALREKQQELQQQGKGDPQLQQIAEQMDKVEEDLVNKRLSNETLTRQQDILSRLLEHEKAERERELDNQRKSESAQQRERPLPPAIQEYLKQREAEIDMFKAVNPSLSPYYRYLVDEYFQSLRGN